MTSIKVDHDVKERVWIYRLEIHDADLDLALQRSDIREKLDMLETTPWLSAKVLALASILREIEKAKADDIMDRDATVADRPKELQ